jgi:hypothetical protein
LAVAQSEFALVEPKLLTLAQIADILPKADMAINWLNDVKTYALEQAVKGVEVPGHKLVEGRSTRRYGSIDDVANRLREEDIDEALVYERSLLGITAMEKALGGRKQFDRVLGDLIVKPAGKPTLVLETDKREAIDPSHGFSAIAE